MFQVESMTGRSLICLAVFAASCDCVFADEFRKVLTDTGSNTGVDAWQVNARDITPECKSPWSIRKFTLRGGRQAGVDVIEIDNGRLKMQVCPTRGMGILWASLGDVRLGWDSPVRETVHPRHINLSSRDGLGWLEGFNEWMCRCGLESNGHPGLDSFINNVGDEAQMQLTLHGKIANLPAQRVEIAVDRQPPWTLRIRGRVDERMMFGPKLELQTELSTVPGSNTFRVDDRIVNHGAQPQEFQVLYHANFGSPLLEKGAQLVAPVKRVIPFNDHAARSSKDFANYGSPTTGFVEQVYKMHLAGDADRNTTVMLRNQAGDRGSTIKWSLDQLPWFTQWKNTGAIEDGYVTGLEPGTNFPHNRSVERKKGRVPTLGPGETQSFSLDFAILTSREEVQAVEVEITKIDAGAGSVIDDKPEALD